MGKISQNIAIRDEMYQAMYSVLKQYSEANKKDFGRTAQRSLLRM
jgi:hypothetical protein